MAHSSAHTSFANLTGAHPQVMRRSGKEGEEEEEVVSFKTDFRLASQVSLMHTRRIPLDCVHLVGLGQTVSRLRRAPIRSAGANGKREDRRASPPWQNKPAHTS